MLAHDYALALAQELEDGKTLPAVLSALDRVLQKKGHEKLRPRILRELEHVYESGTNTQATVTVRTKDDLKRFASAIKEAGDKLGIESEAEPRIDATLVGGFTLSTGARQIDRSYKHALINLYRRIITK